MERNPPADSQAINLRDVFFSCKIEREREGARREGVESGKTKERERQGEREKERGRERESVCVRERVKERGGVKDISQDIITSNLTKCSYIKAQ